MDHYHSEPRPSLKAVFAESLPAEDDDEDKASEVEANLDDEDKTSEARENTSNVSDLDQLMAVSEGRNGVATDAD
ncbi:hypothetical protein DM02DRAFT_619728 [Periconia macrospinosa]|uniref:Uncharacterized protein n=1 Tax=Periconia macrospinosa TaxID=97972 RepID=A0A2V1D416_9PLEO|nr:hypothetical protein DM02DRAFT_619728 [Periconia macrospinosa]